MPNQIPKHCDLCQASPMIPPEALHLHAQCHMHAPLHVTLIGNQLILRCYSCGRYVANYFILKNDDVSVRKVKRRLKKKQEAIDKIIDAQLAEEEDR